MEVVPDENDGQVVTVWEGAAVLSDDADVVVRRLVGDESSPVMAVVSRVGESRRLGPRRRFLRPCGLSGDVRLGYSCGCAGGGRSGGVAAGAGLGW